MHTTDSDRAVIPAIDAAMQAFVDGGKVAGIAALVAVGGRVAHEGCYGMLDLAAGRPVAPDSLFRIYSLTKPVACAAVLSLWEEGRFALDDPATRWLPELAGMKVMPGGWDPAAPPAPLIPLERPITIHHLLTHTAGLGYGFMGGPVEALYREAGIFDFDRLALRTPLAELPGKVAGLQLVAQPGETWHYSLAHDLLGCLVERAAGRPFDVFLRERILDPLGMADTGFTVPAEKRDRFGPLYHIPEGGGLAVLDDPASSPFTNPDTPPSGGVGLVSTPRDYLRFLLMLTRGGELEGARVLRRETVAAMLTNQLAGSTFPVRFDGQPSPGQGYGLGIAVQVDQKHQIGWVGVSGTSAWIYPGEEMVAIAMPQMWFNWEASDEVLRLAVEACGG
jgi:CubicO group peptidase (beta-lactamase class C family)